MEHISYWLHKYEGKYAAEHVLLPASPARPWARAAATTLDDWCIGVGDMADYLVETGSGATTSPMTRQWHIFKKAEDNGFVHQITNIDGEQQDLCHLQLQRQRLQRPAHQPAVQHAQHVPLAPMWPRWKRKSAWPAGAAWSTAPPVR